MRFLAFALLLALSSGCTIKGPFSIRGPFSHTPDEAVECNASDEYRHIKGNVRLAQLFDETELSLQNIDTICLPTGTVVRLQTTHDPQAVLVVRKHYSNHSVGGRPYTIPPDEELRRGMGCAYKIEGRTLFVATVGEYGFIEGGQSVNIQAHIPSTVNVRYMDELSIERPWKSEFKSGSLAERNPEEWTRCKETPTQRRFVEQPSPP